MANEYVLLTDSSSDLPLDIISKYDIKITQLDVTVDGGEPTPNDKVDIADFYSLLRSGKMASTSAVSINTFKETIEPFLKDGKDVLYIGFSSGLSSTYNWSKTAVDELSEKYPERKVFAVDTLAASLGEGMLVYLAALKKEAGATIEEVRDYVEDNKLNLCHWFTVDDLFFLKRGGRVSSTTALLGTMLSIKPVLHVDDEGKLINVSKARGRKAAITALLERMKQTAIDPANQTIFISHGDCLADAEMLADMIKKELGVKEVIIGYVGPVIGAHSGPGTLALFFLGEKR